MSTSAPQTASALDDYLDLFHALSELGVEFVVIGGYAVAAYARLLGQSVFSQDLDLFVTRRTLETVLGESATLGVTVEETPSPREVPVAVLKWRGLEVNLLTASDGLPAPDVEARAAREFRIQRERELTILVADPFDLLRNKLAVNRPKDQPHVALLLSFLEAEVVHDFSEEEEPRARLGAAERLLEVLDKNVLDAPLATRLVPLARTAADFRFLAHRVPTRTLLEELLKHAPDDETRASIERITASRTESLLG